jgi:predicted permease
LIQQLLTETVLLSLAGAAAGVVVAVWAAGLATSVQPPQIASQSYTVLDWHVLVFALGVSLVTGLVFGVGPALYAIRADLSASGKHATVTARRSRTRALLVATQVAVTVVLLTGAVALGRTFINLLGVEMGYELRSVATLNVSLAGTAHAASGRQAAYYDDVRTRVSSLPGVLAVGMTDALPLAIDGIAAGSFQLDNAGATSPLTTVAAVSPGYFAAIGNPVIAGREFVTADLNSGQPHAVVSEEFARAFGEPATIVGRYVTSRDAEPLQIVGVVRGMRLAGPAFPPRPQMFRLSRAPRAATIVVKVRGAAGDRLAAIRDIVQSVDPNVPVFNVKTMEERFAATVARPRFYTTAVVFFGGLALLLAVVGIYGTVSYGVAQRTRELGIRLALGTTPVRLRASLMVETLATIASGAALGVAGAFAGARSLQNLVEGAETGIGPTFVFAVVMTAMVAATAMWTATRRVARLDVSDVLRGGE